MKPNRLNCVSIALLALAVALPLAKAEEKSSVYKSLLAKYDVNKDGRLSVAEREVIRTDRLRPSPRRERRQFRYPDPIVARFDKDGDESSEPTGSGPVRGGSGASFVIPTRLSLALTRTETMN